MAEYHFSLPKYDQLTNINQVALHETKAIALSGNYRSGKTTTLLYRHIVNYNIGIRSILLSNTNFATFYLKQCCRSNNQIASEHIFSINKYLHNPSNYDEIIIDDIDDLSEEVVLKLKNYSDKVSYSHNSSSRIFLNYNFTDLNKLFPENINYFFDNIFHNKWEILLDNLFPEICITRIKENNSYEKPCFYITDVKDNEISSVIQNEIIKEILDSSHSDCHNIGILVPFIKMADFFYNYIKSIGLECSIYHSGMENITEIKNIHITTFKSSKELNFDSVIIPNFHYINENLEKYNLNRVEYYYAITKSNYNLFLLSNTLIEQTDKSKIELNNEIIKGE